MRCPTPHIREMKITILQSKLLTKNTIAELNSLLCELKTSAFKPLTMNQWRKILDQKDVKLFIARQGGRVAGMAMLRWHWLSGGKAGTVEDVVVSLKYQKQGYGSKLMRVIIQFAKKENIAYIDLTSRPDRIAANKLYQKHGWKIRRTNVYRLDLS